LPRDLVVLQLRRLPGAAHAGALAQSRQQQARAGAHAQRLGRGRGPRPDRGDGELSAGRRQHRGAGSAAALHGRTYKAFLTASRNSGSTWLPIFSVRARMRPSASSRISALVWLNSPSESWRYRMSSTPATLRTSAGFGLASAQRLSVI